MFVFHVPSNGDSACKPAETAMTDARSIVPATKRGYLFIRSSRKSGFSWGRWQRFGIGLIDRSDCTRERPERAAFLLLISWRLLSEREGNVPSGTLGCHDNL
jgi:hypothetical protein